MSDTSTRLPEPFAPDLWPSALRPAAEAFWNFHWHLAENPYEGEPVRPGEALASGEIPARLDARPMDEAMAACLEHRLPQELLTAQLSASTRFAGPLRFDTVQALWEFADAWAGSHALLLAGLADAAHSWQEPMVKELARGFFLTGRLANLKKDLARDRVYIPAEELEYAGVSLNDLENGERDERMRRLFWKQIVRARDAMARGEPLAKELEGKVRSAFKKSWLGGLEVLGEIERRDYDVWSRPIALGQRQKIQVWYQSKFGRTTFRTK